MSEKPKKDIVVKLEEEAVELLEKFKDRPIKSIVYAAVILWGIKQVREFLK